MDEISEKNIRISLLETEYRQNINNQAVRCTYNKAKEKFTNEFERYGEDSCGKNSIILS